MTLDRHLHGAWLSLRIGLGLMALLAGIDKFFNLLTSWTMYVSPLAERVLPVPPEVLMRVIGLVEIGVGLAILTSWTRAGAYIAAVWLVAIALNLASTGMFLDLAVRDVVLALAAYTLARLTEAESVVGNASLGHAHLLVRP
ncbi:MAG: DoxX family membrane protein [Vicinamibacterales bacterium]